ncbi:MAG: 1-acyl-sn-glycerol-3-phosphate acyltransferase [Alistipes sp.]|nr:1-acyl-sn-glycerol-3-phosphate acyltransferase [Alistipes sp.]
MLTILYYIFTLLQVSVLFVLSIIVLAVTYPFDKSRRWVHECSRWICGLLYGVPPFIRRTIDGVENIDKNKAYVMVLNHNSGFDIFAAYKIPLNFRWVSKREVFRVPFMGPLLTIHGDIPIERGNASEAMAKMLRLGKLWLSRGVSVAIFPEGTRSKTGQINRFKAGAFNLAKEAEVEILPIVMTGTNEFFRKGWLVNWRNRVGIRVLPPVPVEQIRAMEVKELMQQTQERMVEALTQLRDEIKAEKQK